MKLPKRVDLTEDHTDCKWKLQQKEHKTMKCDSETKIEEFEEIDLTIETLLW